MSLPVYGIEPRPSVFQRECVTLYVTLAEGQKNKKIKEEVLCRYLLLYNYHFIS